MSTRKTIDRYDIELDYGQGWECDCCEWTMFNARAQRKAYRENSPEYPVRIVKRREKISDLEPHEYREALEAIRDSRKREMENREELTRKRKELARKREELKQAIFGDNSTKSERQQEEHIDRILRESN